MHDERIILNVPEKRHAASARAAAGAVSAALDCMKKKRVRLELHVLDDAAMARVNKKTRGKTGPTNVLSFESEGFDAIGGKEKYLGEIYLAPDFVKAKKQRLKFLAIHGLLHLFGYTHDAKRDTMRMERKEDDLLEKIASTKNPAA